MPNSYLPFESTRHVPKHVPTRAAAGLPDEGFVFCGFNNGYKISREIFDLWLSLLQETPDSVLWLRAGSVDMMNNLRSAAESRGVASERLVFAGFEQRMEDHLARLQLADLFLDTLPYNAHTTGTEALWAGVPLVTCLGRTFAGRVGASMLAAAGLPELVCTDLSAYRALAVELSRSPRALLELKARLAAARDSAPLFDTARYTRDLETILVAISKQSVP
jgi:predicted O-linked N-acetylglucosamine transferase (SPINDLY family)